MSHPFVPVNIHVDVLPTKRMVHVDVSPGRSWRILDLIYINLLSMIDSPARYRLVRSNGVELDQEMEVDAARFTDGESLRLETR